MTILPSRHEPVKGIQFVQVMRGIAALSVVIFHTHIILALPKYGGLNVFSRLAVNGWLGVNLFFVISGFIILYAHGKDIGHPEKLPRYAWRRFTRLYPLYWLLLSSFILAAALHLGPANFPWKAGHLVSAFLLVAFVDTPDFPLKVAWTLLFEVKFYAIFAILLVKPRVGVAILFIWVAAILGRNTVMPPPDWGYFGQGWGLLHMWNINFLCGMLACLTVRRLQPRHGAALLGVGIVTLVFLLTNLTGGMDDNTVLPWRLFIFALVFALVITGGVLYEGQSRLVAPRWALLIGDASYSIYLAHSAAISALASYIVKHRSGAEPGWLIFTGVFLAATLAGILLHIIVERPLLRVFRNWPREPASPR